MGQYRKDVIIVFLLFIVSLIIFTRGLGTHGFEYRDDEIFYFKSTQEMILTENYLSPTYFGEDRFQKPILFYWLIVLSYFIFGVQWFAARFVAAFFAGLSIVLTWQIAKEIFNRRVAFLSSAILITSPLFFRHAKNAVPDMPLNFFIVLALYAVIKFSQSKDGSRTGYRLLFFASCAIGFMLKGLAAVVIPVLTLIIFALASRRFELLREIKFFRGLLIFSVLVLPWFLYMFKIHGMAYLDYMLIDETINRISGQYNEHFIVARIKTVFDHIGFYFKTIMAYYIPWSLFLIAGIPFLAFHKKSHATKRESLLWMIIWLSVVFVVFSFMDYAISHYMLVLSTPLAIFISYILLAEMQDKEKTAKIKKSIQKYLCLGLFSFAYFSYVFLFIFLAGASPWWLPLFLVVYGVLGWIIFQTQKLMIPPLILAFLFAFTQAQTSVFQKSGIIPLTTLQIFAQTIHADGAEDAIIAVGSHDIHEKEFQIYFQQQVLKAASSVQSDTREKLIALFQDNGKVYCLLKKTDYDLYLKDRYTETVNIMQEEDIGRKRLHLDKNFIKAVYRLDQKQVQHYIKERLVLVKKEANASGFESPRKSNETY